MRLSSLFSSVVLVAAFGAACDEVPVDDTRSDSRLFPPRGVIRGTVTYVGPRPCSRDGHIVGNAIVLVFDRRNPAPPAGLATSAVNFVQVPGDVLFANEPRSSQHELYCPTESGSLSASAPFTVAPLEGGSYQIAAFYDREGRFWPTFKFKNQPESGDLVGGYLDTEDARRHLGDPTYQPVYLPVDVGVPQPGATPGQIPDFVIGERGFLADNVPVVIAAQMPFTRPYFHPEGAETLPAPATSDANPIGDPLAVPVVTMTQDAEILAPPSVPTPETLTAYQASFRSLRLDWGVAESEFAAATDPAGPFGLQLPPLPPAGKGGLLVFSTGHAIPENPAVPQLWPQAAFVKLVDDPYRLGDPQGLVVQGTAAETPVTGKAPGPLVVMQGLTLFEDNLAKTIAGPVPQAPTTAALRDHVTVLLRPTVLCFDPRRVDLGGVLVTPHLTGRSADANEQGEKPLFDPAALKSVKLVREVKVGCLPTGRYAVTLVNSTGQTWMVPNEIGGCGLGEKKVSLLGPSPTCESKARPVLLSQGMRAVLEIVPPTTDAGRATCARTPVPDACVSLAGSPARRDSVTP